MSYTRTLEKPKKTVSVAPEKEKSTIPKWKLDSIRLRNMIGKNPGAVTKEEKAILEDNSGMVQCQYCSRRFNKKAA